MVFSIDAEKALKKNQHHYMIKRSQQIRHRRNITQYNIGQIRGLSKRYPAMLYEK